jgi:5-methyltetrahydrofolate--homocysteine methyltransferase
MSALLTTTMLAMVETIKALTAAGLRGKVKILIGGAATTESFAREIGADGYGADAHTATELAKTLAAAPA